jgi:ABC-type antimicrobial peptide transport system permease subunit
MMRQLLTETVLLSAFGGILGLVFARWAALVLMSVHIPTDIPLRLFDLRMDWRIFGFSFFASLITGGIAGLLPSIQASRTDLADALKAGGPLRWRVLGPSSFSQCSRRRASRCVSASSSLRRFLHA